MQAEVKCYGCILKKAEGLLEQSTLSEQNKLLRIKEILTLLGTAPEEQSAPVLMARAIDIVKQDTGEQDYYRSAKQKYNKILLEKEAELEKTIAASSDPLHSALQIALIGNYIDFGAMDTVDPNKLEQLLADWDTVFLAPEEYRRFREELQTAERLVYCCDNAGEIVLDKLLIKEIKREYPGIHITVLVRGAPILNDALWEDANAVGLAEYAEILDNGSHIPGTQIGELGTAAEQSLREADLCIAKGQGNFETLHGSGKNIYYLFLCKCDLFTKRFGVKQFTGFFCNERRL
ncbi:MAG: ARMT1-like domain-containing protein [Eubacteriales bacterium]|nr:ARMT1-like domain-containing protein [Eubacteriales bacterium]